MSPTGARRLRDRRGGAPVTDAAAIAPDRPALRYMGGKWALAPWVIAHFPAHRTYVEPFGGAASVLMRKPRAYAEVYNDRWAMVVDFFRVLRDPASAQDLERRCRLTPFARAEFEAVTPAAIDAESDPVERARMFVFRCFSGFGSNATRLGASTGFRSNTSRSGTTPAGDWADWPTQIAAMTARLAGVVMENRDVLTEGLLTTHDSPQTLFYVDPPYLHETRSLRHPSDRVYHTYRHELSDGDHERLAQILRGLAGMVVLSGYPSPLYDRLYGDWRCVTRAARADGARARVEALWLNPVAECCLAQRRLI
jgi:DNA adenine methylase